MTNDKIAVVSSIITPKIDGELKRIDMGALWGHLGDNGDEYMTGEVIVNGETHNIVVKRNRFKRADNQPDWRIYPWTKTQ